MLLPQRSQTRKLRSESLRLLAAQKLESRGFTKPSKTCYVYRPHLNPLTRRHTNQLNFPPPSRVSIPMAKSASSRPFDFHPPPPYHLSSGRLPA